MSVVGFDIGNENCAIAVANGGGINVLLNDASERETPAVVSFGQMQRFLGSAGAAFATTNPKSTIFQIKRLIGKEYKEPSVMEDLRLLPFETSEGPRGGILIHLEYLGKTWTFMPVEILGMFFAHLKQLAEKSLESPVIDCVIGIPSYFTDLQRREYLDAASIAGLRPLQLMHDCTAIALGYGMYKTDISDEGPTNVVFVDIGHSDTQVTIAAFEKGEMTILSHSYDQHLGGRDFDEVLFKHFSAQFKKNYNIDVYPKSRASIRLRASCEKLKKVLSANTEAPLSIDCLIDNKDLNGFITREEFENLSVDLLERLTGPCCEAVTHARLSDDMIHTIELVGSGSRIPAIIRKLTAIFCKEPMRTLNASECVARGCALRCAMLSPPFRVQDYKVQDIFPYSIEVISYDDNNERQAQNFRKGSSFPTEKTLLYYGKSTFYSEVFYTNERDFPAGISRKVGHFVVKSGHIGSSDAADEEKVKGILKVQLNIHGIFQIEFASDGEARRGWAWRWNYNFVVSKNLDIVLTKYELFEALEREKMLAKQDIEVEKIQEKRNTLESFIYDTRTKVLSCYRSLTSDLGQEIILKKLQETEEWLYEEGEDESEQVYIRKLEDIKKLSDLTEKIYKDENPKHEVTKVQLSDLIEKRYKDENAKQEVAKGYLSDLIEKKYKDENAKQKATKAQLSDLVEKRYKDENAKQEATKAQLIDLVEKGYKDGNAKQEETKAQLSDRVEKRYKDENAKQEVTKAHLLDLVEKRCKDENAKQEVTKAQLLDLVEKRYLDENAKQEVTKAQLSDLVEKRYLDADAKQEVTKAQLSDLVEKRYKDENAKQEVTKAQLSDLIEKRYRDENAKQEVTKAQLSDLIEKRYRDENATQEVTKAQLSDLIEKRYKDEYVKQEVRKPLQTCIQEHRVAADLMPTSQKKEVINECIQVEQLLTDLTQVQDSLAENASPIYYSSAISEITQAFKRRCKVIMRSKPSLSKYDEPMDSNQNHDLNDMIVDW